MHAVAHVPRVVGWAAIAIFACSAKDDFFEAIQLEEENRRLVQALQTLVSADGNTVTIATGSTVVGAIHRSSAVPVSTLCDVDKSLPVVDPALIAQDWMVIRHTMWNYVGLLRSEKRLETTAPAFGSRVPKISVPTRAWTIAPTHIRHGSTVTKRSASTSR